MPSLADLKRLADTIAESAQPPWKAVPRLSGSDLAYVRSSDGPAVASNIRSDHLAEYLAAAHPGVVRALAEVAEAAEDASDFLTRQEGGAFIGDHEAASVREQLASTLVALEQELNQ